MSDVETERGIKNVDWESCQNKYGNTLKLFLDQYPTPGNAVAIQKELSLTSKLTIICRKFRQVIVSGRKS